MRIFGLLLLLVATPARADYIDFSKSPEPPPLDLPAPLEVPVPPDPEPFMNVYIEHARPPDDPRRLVYAVIGRIGDPKVNGVLSDGQGAIGGAIGLRRDRLGLFGEYTFGGVGYHVAADNARGGSEADMIGSYGVMHRFGAFARYSLANTISKPESDGFQIFGDVYLDAGVGLEVIRWDEGGTLVRPDISLGLGTSVGFVPTRGAKRGAISMGVRIHIARRDDRDGLPDTCSAPCSFRGAPVSWSDRSAMFETSYAWGR